MVYRPNNKKNDSCWPALGRPLILISYVVLKPWSLTVWQKTPFSIIKNDTVNTLRLGILC